VSGDAGRLQQVVWNLLSNAVKFTPRNGRIQVQVEGRNSRAHIRITDTGRGIDPAFLPYIFERFRQADSSSTRSEGGLGLGLAIVRHVVALHGGTVEAESAGPGQGSTFIVQLPLPAVQGTIASAKPGSTVRERLPVLPLPTLTGLHILVLDDERDARDAVSAVLEGCGARVTPVGSVRDAIAALGLNAPDLIVSDIAMPDEDGLRFIGEVRNLPEMHRHVPALALTAYASAEERRRILAAGFDSYLAKPIEASELAATVARLARSPTSH
jgi:CheY-like chemotaxis protein